MSEFSRLSGVLFEPTKAFTDIAKRPSFWVPLLLSILAAITFVALIEQHIGVGEILRQRMEASPQSAEQYAQMPAQQRDTAIKVTGVVMYLAAVFFPPFISLISAAVLLAIVSIMSAGVRFAQLFAILCYASIPRIISTALSIVVMFLKKPDEFNMNNPLAFNPGAFMDPKASSKFVYALASSLDLFTLWTILLIAVGIKAAAGKRISFGGALTAVVVPWLILVFIGAALAGVFGG